MTVRDAGDEDSDTQPQPDSPPQPARSRLEDEVLEILHRAEQPTSLRDHVRRTAQRRRHERMAAAAGSVPNWSSAGPGTFLLACVALALLATLIRDASAALGALLAIASVACLVMVAVRRGGGDGSGPKSWRGRDLDPTPTTPAWVDSLRDRFRGPPRL